MEKSFRTHPLTFLQQDIAYCFLDCDQLKMKRTTHDDKQHDWLHSTCYIKSSTYGIEIDNAYISGILIMSD